MATGTVGYWNGKSGWIKQTGVSDEETCLARDVMLLPADVVSGDIVLGCTVSFTPEPDNGPWIARSVSVT